MTTLSNGAQHIGDGPSADTEGAPLDRIGEMASGVHALNREVLLVHGTLGDRATDVGEFMHHAIRAALAAGAHLDDVASAVAPHAGALALHRAAGMLRHDAAVLAEVEDHVMTRAEELGGEVPVGDVARMRGVMARARRDVDASVRRAVASGIGVGEILEIAAHAGLALETTDLMVAFQANTIE